MSVSFANATATHVAFEQLPGRFAAKINVTSNGCWEWTGANCKGHGQVRINGHTRYAHRIVYEMFVGPIAEGLEIDHLCENRPCVNPAHLEAVPTRVNQLRGKGISAHNAAVTHCPQGHPYDAKNTYVYPDGSRKCRQCRNDCERRRAERRVAAP